MAELHELHLVEIDEPPLPVRMAMDEQKLAELRDSIAEVGLLQPISVVRADGRYQIVAGHRRFMATNLLGRATIRAVVYEPGEIMVEAAMLAENLHREDVTAAEEAVFFAQLLDRFEQSEEKLCQIVKRSPDYVGDRLRLLHGDPAVFDALRERKIKFSVARELNKTKDDDLRHVYLDAAVRGGNNARTVAQWVANGNLIQPSPPQNDAGDTPTSAPAAPAPYVQACMFCGQSHDPYNMEIIHVHRWELDQLRSIMEAMKNGLCKIEG